jgi:hypothetical protein
VLLWSIFDFTAGDIREVLSLEKIRTMSLYYMLHEWALGLGLGMSYVLRSDLQQNSPFLQSMLTNVF